MKPLIIGHAAAAGEAPENTMAGIHACIDAGADAMEIDVQLSADGVPVLMHDETVDRTTNLNGRVHDLSFADLQEADAGNGERVPSLQQVLAAVAGRLTVMIEMKSTPGSPDADTRLVEAVASIIAIADAKGWSAVHSFQPAIVAQARRLAPYVPAALIALPSMYPSTAAIMDTALRHDSQAVSIEHQGVDEALVRLATKRHLLLLTWTADQPADWDRLAAAGVAGIITNVPGQLASFLGR